MILYNGTLREGESMNYSQSDINFMRQDALRRTREMHNRSNYSKSNVQAGDHPPSYNNEEHKNINNNHQNNERDVYKRQQWGEIRCQSNSL